MKDLIDRQAAVDAFQRLAYDDWNQGASTTWATAFAEGAEIIMGLPSAQPERKTGRWEWDEESGSFLCSECNSGYRDQPTLMGKPLFEYCPMCGSKMEDGDE